MQDLSLQFFKFRNQKVLNPHKPVGTVSTGFFQRAIIITRKFSYYGIWSNAGKGEDGL